MDAATFNKFKHIVYEKSGIALRQGKEALVSARVAKRMRTLGLDDYRMYLRHITEDESGEEIVRLLDAISTNVTSFFREPEHFDFMRNVISEWLAKGQTRFRFWSAAASSGEEPYSMAISLNEVADPARVDMKILATDISTRVLEQCHAGRYESKKVEPVPPMICQRYFDRHEDGNGGFFEVKDILKRLIVFKRLNLSEMPFPMSGPLDIVFCRNVMIYFDNDMRKRLLGEIYRLLKPGGYLMVGHAESLTGMMSELKSVKPSIYMRPE